MSDTIALRNKGIPTVTIAYDNFEQTARLHAKVAKMPSLPIVVIKQWRPGFTAEMARREAEGLADAIFGQLTESIG